MKLFLGSAQFGLLYGATSAGIMPSHQEVKDIIQTSLGLGITGFDTARAYGAADNRLIEYVNEVVEVTDKLTGEIFLREPIESMAERFTPNQKLELRRLLIHDWENLSLSLKKRICNKARFLPNHIKFGASIYETNTVEEVLNFEVISTLQVPMNILDQRFKDQIPVLNSRNIEVIVRSLLLQGKLTEGFRANPDDPIRPFLLNVDKTASALGIDRTHLALSYVQAMQVDGIVFGVHTKNQLIQTMHYIRCRKTLESSAMDDLRCDNRNVTDPRTWERHS